MAKNHSGTIYRNFKRAEEKLVNEIDQREQDASNRENVDRNFNNYRVTEDGSRVWSF